MSELRRHIMMQQGGTAYIHLKGIQMTGAQFFVVDTMSQMQNGFELHYYPNPSSTSSPLIFLGDIPNGGGYGIWVWSNIYDIRFQSNLSYNATFYREDTILKLAGNILTMNCNGVEMFSINDNPRQVVDSDKFAIGATGEQNGGNYVLAGREFIGEFYGMKDTNGRYLLEPCIYEGVAGLYNLAKGEFIAPQGGDVIPIYD